MCQLTVSMDLEEMCITWCPLSELKTQPWFELRLCLWRADCESMINPISMPSHVNPKQSIAGTRKDQSENEGILEPPETGKSMKQYSTRGLIWNRVGGCMWIWFWLDMWTETRGRLNVWFSDVNTRVCSFTWDFENIIFQACYGPGPQESVPAACPFICPSAQVLDIRRTGSAVEVLGERLFCWSACHVQTQRYSPAVLPSCRTLQSPACTHLFGFTFQTYTYTHATAHCHAFCYFGWLLFFIYKY